jgi:hypothetical protein
MFTLFSINSSGQPTRGGTSAWGLCGGAYNPSRQTLPCHTLNVPMVTQSTAEADVRRWTAGHRLPSPNCRLITTSWTSLRGCYKFPVIIHNYSSCGRLMYVIQFILTVVKWRPSCRNYLTHYTIGHNHFLDTQLATSMLRSLLTVHPSLLRNELQF